MRIEAILSTLPEMVLHISEKALYETYISETLRVMCENLAKSQFIGGSYTTRSYKDLINGKREADDRTGEEIAAKVIKEIGLKIKTRDGSAV